MKSLQMSVLAAMMFACGSDSDKKSDPNVASADVNTTEAVATEIDATDKDNFAGLDLDGNLKVASADLANNQTWDLAFKKTVVKVQAPDVTVATLKDVAFEDVTVVPADAVFVSDAPVAGGKETDGLAFHAGDAWYSYDMSVHVINSRNYVYLVKTAEGNIFKVALTDYYNADRLSGYIQVKSQLLQAAE